MFLFNFAFEQFVTCLLQTFFQLFRRIRLPEVVLRIDLEKVAVLELEKESFVVETAQNASRLAICGTFQCGFCIHLNN